MPIVTYECPFAGETHAVPSDDVRVLRVPDGGFVVACDCAPEPLADVDESPHPTTDHLVNIDGRDPSPEEWLALDTAADGWYDVSQWDVHEERAETYGEWWAWLRDEIETIADSNDGRDLEASDDDIAARQVACPDCDASPGRKCQRPSGHHVRTAHVDRRERAINEGAIEPENEQSEPTNQVSIGRWA